MPAVSENEVHRLIEEHLPLVRHVEFQVAAHFPRHVDREELATAGALGLVEAARRYDESRGVPFDRFAAQRIRGAILDAVRSLDFAPRAVRSAAREVEASRTALQNELGRTPTTAETAERVGMTTAELVSLQARVHRGLVLSLDAPAAEGDGAGEVLTLAANIVDAVRIDPSELLEQRERAVYLRDAIAVLPDRLRDVVVGYFLNGESSAELAERLGVTESRVSQMRSEGLALMRAGITAQYDEPATVDTATADGRAAQRRAAYAAALATQSSYRGRISMAQAERKRPPADGGASAYSALA